MTGVVVQLAALLKKSRRLLGGGDRRDGADEPRPLFDKLVLGLCFYRVVSGQFYSLPSGAGRKTAPDTEKAVSFDTAFL